jgi:hypothetical protein
MHDGRRSSSDHRANLPSAFAAAAPGIEAPSGHNEKLCESFTTFSPATIRHRRPLARYGHHDHAFVAYPSIEG